MAARLVGTALGILITGGILFGMLAPIITGYIVKDTGKFGDAFYVAGGLSVIGAIICFSMTRRPILVNAISDTAGVQTLHL